MQRPPISPYGKVLFVGAAFPPSTGGSVVVMRELLKLYDINSYNVISLRSFGVSGDEALESRMLRVGVCKIRPYRLAQWLRFLQMPFVLNKASRYAQKSGAKIIVCIYPSIDFLFLGYMIARKTGLPLIVYMHDTLLEAHQRTSFSWVAKMLHNALRRHVAKTLVMSDGMRMLYKQKYGIDSVVLPHIYSEPISTEMQMMPSKSIFFGGAIYSINDKAVRRVVSAAQGLGVKTIVTGKDKKAIMRQLQVMTESDNIEVKYYERRSEYLSALSSSGVMILALNRLDETEFGEGEISTIFPTKTPEYLASGAPILVHCPKQYYLAEFFTRYKCGLVVDDGRVCALKEGIRKLIANDDEVKAMRRNAMITAKMFSPNCVSPIFSTLVSNVIEDKNARTKFN